MPLTESQQEIISTFQRVAWQGLFALILLVLFTVAFGIIQPPVVAILGDSMEPTYSSGDAVIVTPVDTSTIEEGDIVVVDVPGEAQIEYNYPPSIVHRVASVDRSGPIPEIQTEGDNTGQDPFTVEPSHIQGTVKYHIPYFGYILLYFKSFEGKMFLSFALITFVMYTHGSIIQRYIQDWISNFIQGTAPASSMNDLERPVYDTNNKINQMEDSLSDIDESLQQFADAMSEYASHLESHTQSVQQMGDTAEALQQITTEQQYLLLQIVKSLDLGENESEPHQFNSYSDLNSNTNRTGLTLEEFSNPKLEKRIDVITKDLDELIDTKKTRIDDISHTNAPLNPDPATLVSDDKREDQVGFLYNPDIKGSSTGEPDNDEEHST